MDGWMPFTLFVFYSSFCPLFPPPVLHCPPLALKPHPHHQQGVLALQLLEAVDISSTVKLNGAGQLLNWFRFMEKEPDKSTQIRINLGIRVCCQSERSVCCVRMRADGCIWALNTAFMRHQGLCQTSTLPYSV